MARANRATANALTAVSDQLNYLRANRGYLFYYLLNTLDVRYRPGSLWTIVQRQFYSLIYMIRFFAA